MPWKEKGVKTMRKEFVERVLSQEKSKAALCREYGISRPTGDKWLARYQSGEPLTDRSRSPLQQAGRISAEMEQRIVDYRKQYPAIGACKLHRMLENEGETDLPSVKTFNNVLKRNGLITKEASIAATPYRRFEKSYPNEMWQADYKGHFPLKDKTECYPLNIVDDHSRFNLCCQPMYGETFAELKPIMTRLFVEYGLPFSFLCDNGNPWGTAQSTGFCRYEVWLMELGILTLHGRSSHPQTQGKEERFNGSLTRELLKYHIPEDMEDAAVRFSEYRDFYNEKRPHHSLDLEVPASCYRRSNREMPEKITEWEYAPECQLRRVKSNGFFHYAGQGYFLSEAFAEKEIAIRESHLPGQITLLFRQFRIGRIGLEKRVFTLKRAYLIHGDPRTRSL